MRIYQIFIMGIALSLSLFSIAEENTDHTQHESHNKAKSSYVESKPKSGLTVLSEIPGSGKSREAGFDDRYAMEPTSALDNISDLCAKGSRGLIMLDRQTLEKCGGTLKGLPARHDDKKQDSQTSHQH